MVNILLIDGDSLFQKAFAKLLSRQENCRLAGIAETREQVLLCLKHFHPQIVFTDIVLGEESGINVCALIKEECPEAIIYILSSYCNFRLMQEAMHAGVSGYLSKPVSGTALSALISAYKEEKCPEIPFEDKLFDAVSQRDYKKSQDVSGMIAKKLMEEDSAENRKDKLCFLASQLFAMVPGMEQKQKSYYIQKYALNPLMLKGQTICCNWIIQIITEVFRQICVAKYPRMSPVFQYIEDNKSNEITLTELSGRAGISSGYLSRIFKKYYNISVVDYIHLRKLHMAKYYMLSSEMNISDISFMLGYSEAGYFCKIFKKYEGMTPSAFYHKISEKETVA